MTHYEKELLRLRETSVADPDICRRAMLAKDFIDRHPDLQAVDLDQISSTAAYSKYHFIRVFKSVYGRTPHQYLIDARIEKAKTLLKNNMAVADVCDRIGFKSVGSFTTLFRRHVGMPPMTYVKANNKQLSNF